MSIAELQREEVNLASKLADMEANGTFDAGQYSQAVAELTRVREEIAAAHQKEQAIEEKVHAEEIPFAIPGVDFQNLPAQLITIIEKVVKADRRRIHADHAAEIERIEKNHAEQVSAYEFAIEGHKTDIAAKQEAINECKTANAALHRELTTSSEQVSDLINQVDDLTAKLANAAAQIAEQNIELERLEGEISDYRKAKVYGEREAQKVIDVTPNEAEEINNAIKEFLSFDDWGSIIKVIKPDGSFERVKRDEFKREWQKFQPPAIGGSNDNVSFPSEAPAAVAEDNRVSDTQIPLTPSETEDANLQTDSTNGEVANETVSRAEFEALAARVSQLEEQKGQAAA